MRIPRLLTGLAVLALAFQVATASAAKPEGAKKGDKKSEKKAERKGEKKKGERKPDLPFPPALPGGKTIVTDTAAEFLKPPESFKSDVAIAKTPPTVEFQFLPGQSYHTKLWSNWGDSMTLAGKYYTSMGDHAAPYGNAFVLEYDTQAKTFRQLVDVKKLLNLPEGHYTPGKIHGRLEQGSDGWIYFATHRGAANATTDEYHYVGDWILRCNPASGKSEIVAQCPVPRHSIPNSLLDPDRLIFYGGTAAGASTDDRHGIQFFAYDIKNKKLLYAGPDGPSRAMILARSTGRIYYVPGGREGTLMRFDPAEPVPPVKVEGVGEIGVRAATAETPQGLVYTVSSGQRASDANLCAFNTRTEKIEDLGPTAVGSQAYITTLDADPTGRYVYYMPGAHGSADRDGTPVVQFDVKTHKRKVLAFLHPYYQDKYGFSLKGTFSAAVDPSGDTLYVTWNISRGSRAWDCCGLTTIHIPKSER